VKKLTAALVAVAAAAAAAGGALAITYGQLDQSRHPEVGALIDVSPAGMVTNCSGTLISPTVFLTAAHCDIGKSTVSVSFDSQLTPQSKLYTGTFHGDPLFSQAQGDAHDIAVVVFPQAVAGLTPAQLPSAGLLDAMKADKALTNATRFTAVGYGGEQRSFDGQGKWFIVSRGAREYAVSSFNGLNKGYLRLSQNPAHGDGGTCYGDSGGPNFLGADGGETTTIAAITTTGDTPCESTGVSYRLDTESARAFLGQFVTLP
jgi:Trypsin